MQLKPLTKKTNEQISTLDLSQYLPDSDQIIEFDLSKWLFQGLLLKEKDFRASIKSEDWTQYAQKMVRVYCSTDAILAPWAFMLVANELHLAGATVFVGTEEELIHDYLSQKFDAIDWEQFQNKTVLVKGCGDSRIDYWAYSKASVYLTKYVRRLHYGEACSFVPIFKQSAKVALND